MTFAKNTKNSRTHRRDVRRRLSVESLQSRELMAGDMFLDLPSDPSDEPAEFAPASAAESGFAVPAQFGSADGANSGSTNNSPVSPSRPESNDDLDYLDLKFSDAFVSGYSVPEPGPVITPGLAPYEGPQGEGYFVNRS